MGSRDAWRWSCPEGRVRAIRRHHRREEDWEGLTPLVYLADILCLQMGIGTGVDGLQYRAKDEVLRRFGLGDRDLMGVMVELEARLEQAEAMINLN